MSRFTADPSDFSLTGAYYPKGRVFAMFRDPSGAQQASASLAALPGIGAIRVAEPADIIRSFAKRSQDVGGMPSVGREDQFMLRYVKLAEQGLAGVLMEVGDAEQRPLTETLQSAGAVLAYRYRALVIEELIEPLPDAEGEAAGEL